MHEWFPDVEYVEALERVARFHRETPGPAIWPEVLVAIGTLALALAAAWTGWVAVRAGRDARWEAQREGRVRVLGQIADMVPEFGAAPKEASWEPEKRRSAFGIARGLLSSLSDDALPRTRAFFGGKEVTDDDGAVLTRREVRLQWVLEEIHKAIGDEYTRDRPRRSRQPHR